MLKNARNENSNLNETEFLKKLRDVWDEAKQEVKDILIASLFYLDYGLGRRSR